jgi:predicted metal-dependent peptidase
VSSLEAPALSLEMQLELVAKTEKLVSGSLLRLRMRSPFFATLALYAGFKASFELPTAATDGRDVIYNPAFISSLPAIQIDAVMLHEVLHAALLHVSRRSTRNPKGWNIAADIVVNGVLWQNGFELPENTIRDTDLEHHSVEEVYAILAKQAEDQEKHQLEHQDLLEPASEGGEGSKEGDAKAGAPGGQLSQKQRKALEAHWRKAMAQAASVARGSNQGKIPAGLTREFGSLEPSRLDWRSTLWRYLTHTPTDFEEFDRRMIGRGYYLESLSGMSLQVFLCLDTSGSIDEPQITALLSEVRGILRAYPHVRCTLYYADATAYGPYTLEVDGDIPTPQGGGGTDFRPFFEAIKPDLTELEHGVIVYLTDGFGDFPLESPKLPVLWVVTPGGLAPEGFPFGEVVSLFLD